MTEHAAVIAGAGPTGLMLAAELAIAGTDVVIVDRRASQELDSSRARGLHVRTIEVLDQRGVGDRFVSAGQPFPIAGFAYIPLDVSDFPTRHNYVLALNQRDFERILADWVLGDLGVPIMRSAEVVGVTQDDGGVDLALADGTSVRGQYLVGCDGGRSVVRKAAGIDFVGWDPSLSFLIAEVEMTEEPTIGIRPEGGGIGPVNAGQVGGPYGVVLREHRADHTEEPTLDDLRALLVDRCGTDWGAHNPTWISRFTDMTRQADTYRKGRMLLAGDAAHIHSPMGGQGLNLGVQDAVNLGWKLAQVISGTSPESLLDTYQAERHPVAARALQNTMAQTALTVPDERHRALHATVTDLLGVDGARQRVAAMLIGLDVAYDLGDGHPLLGRRMPDVDLQTAAGATRVYDLLHDGRGLLLNLSGGAATEVPARVRVVDATTAPTLALPLLGEVATPPALLIRPDGHVAWTGELADPSLTEAVASWFGRDP